jgi:hypothetical protein
MVKLPCYRHILAGFCPSLAVHNNKRYDHAMWENQRRSEISKMARCAKTYSSTIIGSRHHPARRVLRTDISTTEKRLRREVSCADLPCLLKPSMGASRTRGAGANLGQPLAFASCPPGAKKLARLKRDEDDKVACSPQWLL